MDKQAKIYIAGHKGMVGSAIKRKLQSEGYNNLVYRTSQELDLRNQQAVTDFFESEKPEYVFLAAAQVGGINANNTYRADFIYNNLIIECNIIHQAYVQQVKKLLFLGSACIYPKLASQPLKEEYLLTGLLEPTNEPYAIAKIAGLKMCEAYHAQYGCNFITVMPANLYGPNDNYDLNDSHVLPAMLRKFYEAKMRGDATVILWGSGFPRREFLHADDVADACLFLMQRYDKPEPINIGMGEDITIKELAKLIKDITGFAGDICWDSTKPDGTPRKLMDVEKLKQIGWQASISLHQGIEQVYKEYSSTPKKVITK